MAWLDDNPPVRSQFRRPRRERPSGVMVVHTAENTPDFVAFDGGAEAVANFIRNRSDAGSYHDLVDSDSAIQLVRWSDEAFQDGTGSNPHAWGGSVATRADVWPLAPVEWRNGAVRQLAHAAARYAQWLAANYGILVPARRISRAESEARVPGFISHAERDPGRRSDPGAGFPWDQFLAEYAAAMGGPTVEDDLPYTPEQIRDLAAEGARIALGEGTALGYLGWPKTNQGQTDLLRAIYTRVTGEDPDDIDEAEIARLLLAGLTAPLVQALKDELPEIEDARLEAAAERGVRNVFADAGTPS